MKLLAIAREEERVRTSQDLFNSRLAAIKQRAKRQKVNSNARAINLGREIGKKVLDIKSVLGALTPGQRAELGITDVDTTADEVCVILPEDALNDEMADLGLGTDEGEYTG